MLSDRKRSKRMQQRKEAQKPRLETEIGRPHCGDARTAIDGHAIVILERVDGVGYAVDARDAWFSGDDGAVDQHGIAALAGAPQSLAHPESWVPCMRFQNGVSGGDAVRE